MNFRVLKIVSEFAFHQVTTSLEENEIPHRVLKRGDSSFPMFGQENFFGRIVIAEEHADFIEKLRLGNEDQIIIEEEVTENPVKKKVSWGRIALIAYAVVVSLLLFRYWNAYRHASENKNYKYIWNAAGTELITVSKKSGNAVEVSADHNYDLNFEKYQAFDKDDNLVYESFDTNEDGLYETFYRYQQNHKLAEQGFDRDKDGIYEYFEIILENGDRLILKDENRDGAYEYLERKRPSDIEK